MNIYAIKDKATGFDRIFVANNDYHAMRMSSDSVNAEAQEKTLLQLHPEDYELYKLGNLNTDNGEIKPEIKFMQNLKDLQKE